MENSVHSLFSTTGNLQMHSLCQLRTTFTWILKSCGFWKTQYYDWRKMSFRHMPQSSRLLSCVKSVVNYVKINVLCCAIYDFAQN